MMETTSDLKHRIFLKSREMMDAIEKGTPDMEKLQTNLDIPEDAPEVIQKLMEKIKESITIAYKTGYARSQLDILEIL